MEGGGENVMNPARLGKGHGTSWKHGSAKAPPAGGTTPDCPTYCVAARKRVDGYSGLNRSLGGCLVDG